VKTGIKTGSDEGSYMAQDKFLDIPMPDIIEQWRYYFSVLQPGDGDIIADIGCNTGDAARLLVREYPRVDRVVGIDNDRERYERALARWRTDNRPPQIEFRLADATGLPFPENYYDRALCVETAEWITNPVAALQEIRRVIKPGGAALVVHSDFDTQVFNSTDKELCRRITTAFTDSGPDGQIGRRLYGLCKEAGFSAVKPLVYTLLNTEWSGNLYAYKVAHMMAEWLKGKSAIREKELAQWLADLQEQHNRGKFFYSINRNICYCVK
jgi:ubiquinone/menaquinone biosynthesis C-methylase UbiE